LAAVAAIMPGLGASASVSNGSLSPPAFSLSGLPALSRGSSDRPAFEAASSPAASRSAGKRGPSVGANVNVIGGQDVVQQATINGVSVKTCNPGKETAQNETTIAVNPGDASNLVAGANDYRLYEPSENRYDASGGFYRSTDGGASWSAGFLPGLVRGNTTAPGPYESAGDPAVAAGPAGTFWYANLAFDRTDNANAVAASRSLDGGKAGRPITSSRHPQRTAPSCSTTKSGSRVTRPIRTSPTLRGPSSSWAHPERPAAKSS
jgi:hypothetical protein